MYYKNFFVPQKDFNSFLVLGVNISAIFLISLVLDFPEVPSYYIMQRSLMILLFLKKRVQFNVTSVFFIFLFLPFANF